MAKLDRQKQYNMDQQLGTKLDQQIQNCLQKSKETSQLYGERKQIQWRKNFERWYSSVSYSPQR